MYRYAVELSRKILVESIIGLSYRMVVNIIFRNTFRIKLGKQLERLTDCNRLQGYPAASDD